MQIDSTAQILGRVEWGTEPWLITIGAGTVLSKQITFWNHDGGVSVVRKMDPKYEHVIKFGYIKIGQNCFIGANSTILCNVSIGDNCIIGANSLITKDIPSGEVWGGIPAKRICSVYEYAEKNRQILKNYEYKLNDENKKEESIKIANIFATKKNKLDL